MINFRYHIVSLTAVFLALIIGILMGTTVVSRATVDGLKANLERAEAKSAAVHRTNNRLSHEVSQYADTDAKVDAALTENVLANAVQGALVDVPVLVVTTKSVDKDLLQSTIAALVASGASVQGTLVLDDRMVLNDADSARVRKALDLGPKADAQAAMIRQLAISLAEAALPGVPLGGVPSSASTTTAPPTTDTAPPGSPAGAEEPTTTVAEAGEPDAVVALRQEGLITFRSVTGTSDDDPALVTPNGPDAKGFRYVMLPGVAPDPTTAQVLSPLVASLAQLGPVPQVAGNGPRTPTQPGFDAFLTPLLQRKGVKGHVSTVDDLVSFAGNVAMIHALVDAADGHFGSYGIGDTASSVMPVWHR